MVEEKQRIAEVIYEGQSEVREVDIRKGLRTLPKGLFNRFDARLDAEKIRRVYLEKGYYFASVTHRVRANDSNGLEVVFDIYEGPRVVVKEMRFEGNDRPPHR